MLVWSRLIKLRFQPSDFFYVSCESVLKGNPNPNYDNFLYVSCIFSPFKVSVNHWCRYLILLTINPKFSGPYLTDRSCTESEEKLLNMNFKFKCLHFSKERKIQTQTHKVTEVVVKKKSKYNTALSIGLNNRMSDFLRSHPEKAQTFRKVSL